MRKVLKWIGIVLAVVVVLGAAMAVYSTFGLNKALALEIRSIDLERIPDGTYTGTYESYRWTNSVKVTVYGHQITAIQPVTPLNGRDEIVAELTRSIIGSQSNDVDAVSGATASSKAFLKAVELALSNAGT